MGNTRIVLTITLYFLLTSNLGCSATGWAIAGYELSPSDTTNNTVFKEIVCQDSIEHWYANTIYHGDNYCHLHNRWEHVEVK